MCFAAVEGGTRGCGWGGGCLGAHMWFVPVGGPSAFTYIFYGLPFHYYSMNRQI